MRWTSAAIAVLALALAGSARAQPAPAPLSLLDVPFISQSEALCGGAAAATVLRYWGERGLSAGSFAHLVDRSAAGIRTSALVGELRQRGWNATGIEGTPLQIAGELEMGRPVLVLIEDRPGTFHYIVIVASPPRALVFHDPARAPMRVMSRDEFMRRWMAADRWMAVIVPGSGAKPAPDSPAAADVVAARPGDDESSYCGRLIAQGVAQAQASDLDAAERTLAAALSCPGPAAMRELAGVRLLQRRWPDVETLAGAAVAIAPGDEHAWRLLGTSRFVQDDRPGALEAWNHVSEPKIDLIAVAGLTRTRQRPVEQLIGERAGDVLTPDALVRARRRLDDLPSASSTRLEYVPVPSALVELRATVNERPIVPGDVWSYAALGLVAAARQEVEYATGSIVGGGERVTGAWRFRPERPRLGASLAAPAPWGGIWEVRAASERQPFDIGLPPAERTTADLRVSNWITSVAHLAVRGGLDEWAGAGAFFAAGAALRLRSAGDRADATLTADTWRGRLPFSAVGGTALVRSSTARRGFVLIGRGGAAATTSAAPLDTWFGGDTGDTRDMLLRAHPLIGDGRLRAGRLGRRIVHGSLEAQRWWRVSFVAAGAALFADAALVGARRVPGSLRDVDVGVGARLAVPGLPGIFRADAAKSLRGGATILSFVYQP